DERYVGWRADSYGWSPKARSVGDVDLCPIHVAQSGDHRLLKPGDVVERDHLAAMRMPGKLKVHFVPRRLMRLYRLMCQQDNGFRRVTVSKRDLVIRAAGRVVDARQVKTPDLKPLILKWTDPQPGHLRDPLLRAGIVLVIPGHEE